MATKSKSPYTKEYIQEKIRTNNAWLERALIVLFNRQTDDEQRSDQTIHANNRGFSGVDSRYLTYCVKYIKKGNHLSGKHLEKCRKIVPKYWRQIKEEIDAKSSQN